jgi:predicted PurR-regulated permease PerM
MRLRNLESRVFFGLVLLITALFLWMVRGFLFPVFWAAVFAVLFRPFFLRTADLLRGRRSAAAFLCYTGRGGRGRGSHGHCWSVRWRSRRWALYTGLTTGAISLQAPIALAERSLPRAVDVLARYGIGIEQVRTSMEGAAIAATQYIGGQALAIGQNALSVTIHFGLMLYFLFFFFRDGERIVAGIIRALPMGDAREARLLARFAAVSRATVKGTLLVAAAQGALGGILFAIVGIQGAVFWGVVMGVLSLLPAIGAALVWVPAAVILLATGAVWQAVVVVIGGTFVIGLVDNLLRPILVGREAQMPDYLGAAHHARRHHHVRHRRLRGGPRGRGALPGDVGDVRRGIRAARQLRPARRTRPPSPAPAPASELSVSTAEGG